MKTLKILDWPAFRFYSESHPFYKWRRELKERGIETQFFTDHQDPRLNDADFLLIHSRYFEHGWQNIAKRTQENEDTLRKLLIGWKKTVGMLLWYDAADSTGSNDFPIIGLVDRFVKKQVFKNNNYYSKKSKSLRVWMDGEDSAIVYPCPKDQLHKIRLGWNIGLNDYRYFGYKLSRLSNYLRYGIYPMKFSAVDKTRDLDLSFRGTVLNHPIAKQRNKVIQLMEIMTERSADGKRLSKREYRNELRNSKLCISPYGWGEVCYRDFEIVISGALLIKPSMEHLSTFPNIYIPNETYIPVSWDLDDLTETVEHSLAHYDSAKQIAQNGQDAYRKAVCEPASFINAVFRMIS